MASIIFDISSVINGLKEVNEKHSDMSQMFRAIAALEESNTLLRYRDEVDPEGRKWRDPITIRRDGKSSPNRQEKSAAWHYWKASNFHAVPKGWHFFNRALGDKTMRDTGILMSSIGSRFGKDFASVGTNVKYGEYVQSKGFVFLGVNKTTKENVRTQYRAFMKGLL